MKSYPFVRSGEAILNSVYRLTGDLVGIINRGKYRGQLQIGTNERDCYEEGMNKSSARGERKEREVVIDGGKEKESIIYCANIHLES